MSETCSENPATDATSGEHRPAPRPGAGESARSLLVAGYRILLHLYPRAFHDRYHDELITYLVLDRGDAEFPARSWSAARFWLRAYGDVLTAAGRQRARLVKASVSKLPHVLADDSLHALRFLRRRPMSSLAQLAALSLVLALATMWTVVWRGHFSRSGASGPDRRIAFVTVRSQQTGMWSSYAPAADFMAWRRGVSPGVVEAFVPLSFSVRLDDREMVVDGSTVTPGLPAMFGVRPTPRDGPIGSPAVLLDSGLLEELAPTDVPHPPATMLVNGRELPVAGLIPPALMKIGAGRVWLVDTLSPPASTPVAILARAKDQADLERLQGRLQLISSAAGRSSRPILVGMDELNGPLVRGAAMWVLVQILLSMVLLAIGPMASASGNRGPSKPNDVRLYMALGASAGRLARQRGLAGLLLTAPATGVSLLLVLATRPSWQTPLPTDMPAVLPPERVIASVCVLVGLGASVLVGLAYAFPMLPRARFRVSCSVRGEPSRREMLLLALAVTVTVASVSLALVPAIRIHELPLQRPGFDQGAIRIWRVDPTATSADSLDGRQAALRESLRVALEPDTWALTSHTPISAGDPVDVATDAAPVQAGRIEVSPSYFRVMGIPLLAGTGDLAGGVAVSRSLARALWPDGPVMGRDLRLDGRSLRVTAVVGDVLDTGTGSAKRVYVLLSGASPRLYLVSRAMPDSSPVAGITGNGRRFVLSPLGSGRELLGRWHEHRFPQRSLSTLSIMALLLIIATTSQALCVLGRIARARRRDIALRMALGSTPGAALRPALKPLRGVLLIGLAGGFLVGWPLVRVGASVFEIEELVALSTLLAAILLMATASALVVGCTTRTSLTSPDELLRVP